MTEADDEAAIWKTVGERLGAAREALRLTKREAARRAGFSEITWRNLEAGERQAAPGVVVPMSPRDDTLASAAVAVELDPAEIFELVGRPYVPKDDDDEIHLSASGVDLAELAEVDPEAYEQIMGLAHIALDRARDRRQR